MPEKRKALVLRVLEGVPCSKPVEALEPVFRPPDHDSAVRLRRAHRLGEVAGEGDDFRRARRLMNWVRGLWNHGYDHAAVEDGSDALQLIPAGRRGCRFSCGNYAQTFVQCCLAIGIPARRLGIRRRETDFPHGYLGNHGHVVAEAYCRELGKWVLFDADLNGFYTIEGKAAGAVDLHESWHEHRGRNAEQILDEPFFVPIYEHREISREQMRKNWRDFNRHRTIDYYYYVYTWLNQGFAKTDRIGIGNETIFYSAITPPPLALNFREGRIATVCAEREEQFNWPTDRTYVLARMLGKRPSRRVELLMEHTMPFFSHFELSVGREAWRRARGGIKVINLPMGRRTVRVRCVDAFGRPGHEARLQIQVKHVPLKGHDASRPYRGERNE